MMGEQNPFGDKGQPTYVSGCYLCGREESDTVRGEVLQQLLENPLLLQGDGEPSIVALKAALAAGVEGVPREFPVGYHQGNGQIEQVCKEIKMHIRVGREAGTTLR